MRLYQYTTYKLSISNFTDENKFPTTLSLTCQGIDYHPESYWQSKVATTDLSEYKRTCKLCNPEAEEIHFSVYVYTVY